MKKWGIWVLGIALLVYGLTWITGTHYIWKTLVYNYVDYDDYTIFENRTIKAEPADAEPWPESSTAFPISQRLDSVLTALNTIGFLALQNGEVVAEKYWPGFDASTKANSFSVAKSYIGMLTGMALDQGLIKKIDDPVTQYLPELEGAHFQQITIRHLLTMSSGLEWIERYNMPINHTSESYYGTDLWGLVKDLNKKHEPGTVWHYKGCDPQLLAFVIAEVSGTSLSDYLSQHFWKPIGATDDALWSLDHEGGMEKAYCCINTHARNFARIGELYRNHGKWNGQQLIDSAYVWQSVQPHGIDDRGGEPTLVYGYQWWTMRDKGKAHYYCRGLNGQYVLVLPELNMTLVRVGQKRDKGSGNHPVELLEMVKWAETVSKP